MMAFYPGDDYGWLELNLINEISYFNVILANYLINFRTR